MAEDVTTQQTDVTPGPTEQTPDIKNDTYDFLTVPDETSKDNKSDDTKVQETNYPPFIPDEYKVPSSFKDEKEELASYKKAYTGMIDLLQSDDFEKSLQKAYKDTLVNQDWEVKNLKAIDQALKGENKEQILKLYFPELLEGTGRSPFMSKEEKINFIDDELQKQFGKDYRNKWNADEVIEPGSFSAEVYAKQNELMTELNRREAEYKEKNKPVTPEMIEQQLMKSYNDEFKEDGFTVEEYRSFVEDTKNYKPSMADIHHMLYFEHYIEQAKEEGRKEGIGTLKNGLKKVTTQSIEKEVPIKPKEELLGDYEEMRQNFYRTKK